MRGNLSAIKSAMLEANRWQNIANLDVFDLVASDSAVVIVVQVHNRTEYLRHLVSSLRKAVDIDHALLVFSHDFYSDELNDIVASIDFCPVRKMGIVIINCLLTFCISLKAKFHYAIQLAKLVCDELIFKPVCDLLKAKFHYAIQVSSLVSDLSQTVSSYLDMLTYLEPGRRPVCSWLSTGFRLSCDTHTQGCDLDQAKFHYTIQLASRELVCDQLVSWIA